MSSGTAGLTASLDAIAAIIAQGAQAGVNLLESLMTGSPQLLQNLEHLALGAGGLSTCDSCQIPPPCWMPKPLGEVKSVGRAGDTVKICFVITNCTMATHHESVFTSTPNTGLTFTPPFLTLGPMERAEIEVSYHIPGAVPLGEKREILMWVRGCKLFFLRWIVIVSAIPSAGCYEVEVKDCPDLIHHWYDHFYCPRPCLEPRGTTGR
jgi:hypothetical protein